MGYHDSKALSKSAIDLLLECPALYKAWEEDVEERKVTPAMEFGTAFHLKTLESEKFRAGYAVTDLNLATKAGREFKESLAPETTILKEPDYEQILLMRDAVLTHPQAKHLFHDYEAEKEIYWEQDGIACKAKPDMVSTIKGMRFCVDLKTTDSANPEQIQRSLYNYHYYRQAAWYLRGLEAIGQACEAFLFIFVDKAYPHLVTMCQLDERALEKGRRDCDRALEILKECRKTGHYPCYTKDILTMGLPHYAYKGE